MNATTHNRPLAAPDLTYSDDGLFVRFLPETTAGEDAWRELAERSEGTGAFLMIHRDGIIRQLRAAGYRVAKRRASKADDTDAILAELGA